MLDLTSNRLNYYAILGVSKDASPQDIKQAFKNRVLEIPEEPDDIDAAFDRLVQVYTAYSGLLQSSRLAEDLAFMDRLTSDPAVGAALSYETHVKLVSRFMAGSTIDMLNVHMIKRACALLEGKEEEAFQADPVVQAVLADPDEENSILHLAPFENFLCSLHPFTPSTYVPRSARKPLSPKEKASQHITDQLLYENMRSYTIDPEHYKASALNCPMKPKLLKGFYKNVFNSLNKCLNAPAMHYALDVHVRDFLYFEVEKGFPPPDKKAGYRLPWARNAKHILMPVIDMPCSQTTSFYKPTPRRRLFGLLPAA